MRSIYSIVILLYGIGIRISSLINSKAKEWIDGRINWKENLKNLPDNSVWFHCASLGEFDMALPIMKEVKSQFPESYILVSFFSPSGMKHYHKRNHYADKVVYLPLDTKKNSKQFIQLVQPKLAVFVKYEFWSNFIFELKSNQIKVVSVCTILRPNQIYFKSYGSFFKQTLRKIDFFFVQNTETKKLLESIGINNSEVVGDTRFDNVIANKLSFEAKSKSDADVIFSRFLENEKAIIFGSSWEPEEQILAKVLPEITTIKIIIAPHDVSDKNCLRLLNLLGNKAIRFSEFQNFNQHNILILDTIGHLSSAYFYGKIAFIGGGFSGQLHNILEPAVFGLPILFGPKHAKFPEASQFLNEGFAFEVNSAAEFLTTIKKIENQQAELAQKSIAFVEKQKGVADKIVSNPLFKRLNS